MGGGVNKQRGGGGEGGMEGRGLRGNVNTKCQQGSAHSQFISSCEQYGS